MNLPGISVIISAKNSSLTIKKCLDSVLGLDYPDYEIIVVDDGSKDLTQKILEDYSGKIKVLTTSGIGPSAARNLAASQANAEYIAFTDSDCIVDKSWLRELSSSLLRCPDAIACGGIQRLPRDATNFERKVFLFMKRTGFITDYMRKAKSDEIIEVEHNPSCNVLYKRNVFLGEGGFLEGLWPGEDVELDYRLKRNGHRLVFNPKGVVYHYRPKRWSAFWKMMYRYGLAQGFLVRKYGVFRKIQSLPFLTIMFFILAILYGQPFLIITTISFLVLVIYFKLDFLSLALGIFGFMAWNLGFYRRLVFPSKPRFTKPAG